MVIVLDGDRLGASDSDILSGDGERLVRTLLYTIIVPWKVILKWQT